ncbi:hypothetical protein CspeluHIS016_0109620 [Cutaneotrichosporon spelunceum]|uniref:WW domain-containing protein n=1 Tax=Cutaneotrichosporon spelunceum TaxID=1672016 RepID=A0AAD3TPZ2_9TREE|nr:hypothetical protein CspeluHIS016_0109620 [Cutaneotrichosporon spelunceum]
MSSPKPNTAETSDDLPSPWVRQWDETYNTWFYINPTTTPPTTTWTHPLAKEGEAHPEQVADPQAAAKVAEEFVAEHPQDQEAQQVTDRGLGSLLMGGSSGGMSGMGGMGGSSSSAMGGGLGGLLLGALLGGKSKRKTYGFGGGGYSHSMGPPPFMGGGMGMGPFGMGGGMGGRPYGMGGMGMGGMGMGGMGMGRPHGHGGGGYGGGYGGHGGHGGHGHGGHGGHGHGHGHGRW